MDNNPMKIGAVLGDPTRYSIYRYLLSGAGRVTVQDVASRFDLHPNVARMHLNKLKEIGLLVAHSEKSGHTGRPGHVYELSGESVSLNLPPRDYRLLSELLCQALATMGDQGLVALEEVSRTYGRKLAHEVYAGLGVPPGEVSVRKLLEGAATALSHQGLEAEVVIERGVAATLKIRNCSFEEVAARHPQFICHLCHGLVQGVLETHLAVANLREDASIARGDKHCAYVAEKVAPPL